ncbi:aromatic ring-hydroxylating dioxygenase subunit alpha [Motiliproteus sp. MSK22-1]|uniref:aromatic ring-hydroxylating oxygenase subunit alpha n=1 Tax=Motiliproteus sp. MSK22-1 TaxID=1897630 RepID=UPI0009781F73|nr:aromatic ring-hydroxylating dioxygenase subunit alpha [Motiliproteus sp. MSK22-1]OMH36262.1 Rieske (2Fe-2S) protein [Motiliproteus sp. MSK22-1]
MTDQVTDQTTLALINQRKPGHALGRDLYLSADVYRDDLEQIWHKEWIFAGHSFEIEQPGEYLTLQIGDFPVVIVRDSQGHIRAFHNACRHRGSRLCAENKGKVAKLVCPYHRWTYDLDGKLMFAANMGEHFNNDDHGLMPVHCEVVNSYIYVCTAEQAPDFAEFRQALSKFITPHNLDNCKVAFESNLIEKGNWKLVFENNRECYHCDSNHPELLKSFMENPAVAGVGGNEDPELIELWERCEAAGLPSRMHMDENGQYRMTRIPLFNNSVSYTMDGKPAVNSRLDNTDEQNIGALLYFNYPSTWNHFLGDHALSFRILPLGPGETLVTTKWLVHKDSQVDRDYDLDTLTKVWLATNDQDRQLVEETFRGLRSPSYVPGPFSEIAENGVCQFVDWYCDTMKSKLSR